ncbi:hypothetical protein Hs30E_10460 [Lactococcus hodotermopsidis]|uniref:Tox-GHH domain-containing protein n=1 Tax=Pseudolactococcus hodotermopsidis TaxID=2709157 RepID=A0A6A0BCX3_9LACT|nr:hypothetical protein [Lactococcus hodotermopsidis]GFH42495.1 hypothetical protein Hs30E_10460 [Lactococcus hodotermopsidis]
MDEKPQLSVEEKKKLNSERQKAVRDAWGKEKARVAQGEGTRDWSPEQQKEIMENGHADGYDGHHMKCVSSYPEQAGNPDNIQFLTHDEHIQGAHQGNTHTRTNGYYNPDSGQMENFNGDELKPTDSQSLSEPCYENGEYITKTQSVSAFKASVKSTGQEPSSTAHDFNASIKNHAAAEERASASEQTRSAAVSR